MHQTTYHVLATVHLPHVYQDWRRRTS